MGLVIVFLDVGSNGWDWVADPVGWVLVLMGLAPVKELLPGHGGAVAVGLVIVFVDVGSNGWDGVGVRVDWVLVLMGVARVKELLPGHGGVFAAAWGCLAVSVLTLPPNSVDSITPTLGWLFSLPT